MLAPRQPRVRARPARRRGLALLCVVLAALLAGAALHAAVHADGDVCAACAVADRVDGVAAELPAAAPASPAVAPPVPPAPSPGPGILRTGSAARGPPGSIRPPP